MLQTFPTVAIAKTLASAAAAVTETLAAKRYHPKQPQQQRPAAVKVVAVATFSIAVAIVILICKCGRRERSSAQVHHQWILTGLIFVWCTFMSAASTNLSASNLNCVDSWLREGKSSRRTSYINILHAEDFNTSNIWQQIIKTKEFAGISTSIVDEGVLEFTGLTSLIRDSLDFSFSNF
mmetsp:Transcript_41517/g.87151  ORF Transcript_41517/g.87151 Transcript_41517/m.87151 type:complete len:179 (+) Transcript_41517:1609-2145(+)